MNVILGSVNNITKAFNACLTVKGITDCDNNNIDNTINAQPNTTITATTGTAATTPACFVVAGTTGTSLAGFNACISFSSTGQTVQQSSTAANIKGTSACAATGICTP